MSVAQLPLRIAQISDIHCGTPTFDADLMSSVIERINRLNPDLVAVVGDLTAEGYKWEFDEAADWIGRLDAPTVVVPGNHDSRNVGHLHFERHFGPRFIRYRLILEDERAERLQAGGLTVVAVDSSQPDVNDGHIGREWYGWIEQQFDQPQDVKVFIIHHHLVAIPSTGRERNTVVDAGDLLDVLTRVGVDIVLSGHKHVPFFWGINGVLISNSGTASTRRLRGLTPQSWNELQIDASTIKVNLHYPDGRRDLAVIRSRANRSMIREALYLTSDFRATNRMQAD